MAIKRLFKYTSNEGNADYFPCQIEKIKKIGTSVVAQWIRIRLPMQGTQTWSLVWEDSTCLGATPYVLQLPTAMCLEPVLQTREATARRSLCITTKRSLRSPQLKKTLVQQQRPRATSKKIKAKERKRSSQPQCWRQCEKRDLLTHCCWWESKIVQSFYNLVIYIKISTCISSDFPFDPGILRNLVKGNNNNKSDKVVYYIV